MGMRINKSKRILSLVLLLLLCLPILFLLSHASEDSLPIYTGTVNALGSQWYFGEKDGEMHPVDIMEKQHMEPGKTYVLSTVIDYDGGTDFYPSAIFLVNNYGVQVYYEDTLVFHRTKEDLRLPTVSSLGLLAFSLPLGYNCKGNELRLELDPMLSSAADRILPDVQFGDYATTMRQLYITSLPNLVLITAILFLCVSLLLIGSVYKEMREKCLNLACFAAAFSVYRLTETLFVQHMFKSPYLLYLCNHLALTLLPIFLINAYKSRFSPPFQTFTRLVKTLCWINLGVQLLFHFTGVMDLRYMIPMTQICCLLACLAMAIPMVVERKKPIIRRVTLEVMPLFIANFLDCIAYFIQSNSGRAWFSMGNFISVGFLITLIIVIYEVRKTSEQAAAESIKSQFFQEMAYRDSLTGVSSRAAFDEEVKKFSAGHRSVHTLLCVAADLNGLKAINDTYGHQEGDELIRRCAVLLVDCFQSRGQIFRIGGDEFIVFLHDVSESEWPKLKEQFDAQREKSNENQTFPLSVAMGCAAVVNGDLVGALQLADERMYQDKDSAPHRGDLV